MKETTRFALGVAAGLIGVVTLFAGHSSLWLSAFALSAVLTAPRPAQDAAANQTRAVTIIIVVLLAVFGTSLLLLLLAPAVLDSVQRWGWGTPRIAPIWVRVLLAAAWLGTIVFRLVRFERDRPAQRV